MTVKELQQILRFADPNIEVYVSTANETKPCVRAYNSNHYDAESNLKENILVLETNPKILWSFMQDGK